MTAVAALEHPIATSSLTKRYSAHVLAVDQLELRVRKGEVYGFLGPNGAGKTTTLKMLVGLIRPTAGQAVVAGHAPGDPAGLARIGCLVESPAFYPYLSGRDNLRAAARAAGAPESRVDAALDEVGLLPRGKDKFKTYSLGMKQRLGVGAALLKEPDLLILDEPSNGLDPQGMLEMRDLIGQLRQDQRTVLLSSHLLGEVQQICDRVGVINGGKLIKEGTIEEIRGGTSLLVVARPAEQALGLLSERLGDKVRLVNGELLIDVEPQRAAEINHWLVSAGIGVWQLRSAERSLEDVFLQLTGPVGAQP